MSHRADGAQDGALEQTVDDRLLDHDLAREAEVPTVVRQKRADDHRDDHEDDGDRHPPPRVPDRPGVDEPRPLLVDWSFSGSPSRVDGEVVDRAVLDVPLREDLPVAAVGLERLERVDDGRRRSRSGPWARRSRRAPSRRCLPSVSTAPLVCFTAYAVTGESADMASALPLARSALTLTWRSSTIWLIARLAGGGALLAAGGQVVDLRRALLHADVEAAGVVGVDLLGVALGDTHCVPAV